MASVVKIKRSAVAGKAPTTSDIISGELALNTADGRLYSSKGVSTFEVGANTHSLYVGTGGATFANGAFSLPTTDGSSDQVIKTDGSGTLSWVDQSGGSGGTIQTMPFYNSSGSLDTITITGSSFTFYDSTGTADSIDISTDINLNSLADVSVAAPSLNQVLRYNGTSWVSSDSAGASWSALTSTNTAIRTLVGQNLANTNTYIATKLDSSSYTTADVQSKAALANTNAYIASVQSDVDANEATERAALANTNAYIATKAPTASPTFTGTVTVDAVDLSANNPRIRFDDSDTSNNGEIRLSNTALRIESDEDNAVASSLITFHIDAAEKMRIDSNGNVTTAGSITPGSYRPGEIIETIACMCDGSTVSVQSGNYTITNCSASQAATTSYVVMTGSSVAYTPPAGTKRVVYRYNFKWDCTGLSGISHFKVQIDGTDVIPSSRNYASNYASTNWHHANLELGVEWVFDCDAASDDAANGKFTSWTSAKTIRALHRAYGSGYAHTLHNNVWWDGTGASGTRQAPIKPFLYIQAIA